MRSQKTNKISQIRDLDLALRLTKQRHNNYYYFIMAVKGYLELNSMKHTDTSIYRFLMSNSYKSAISCQF